MFKHTCGLSGGFSFAPIVSNGTYGVAAEKLGEPSGGHWSDDELLSKLSSLSAYEGTSTLPTINDCPDATIASVRSTFRVSGDRLDLHRLCSAKARGRRLTLSAYTREPVLQALRRLHETKGQCTAPLVNAEGPQRSDHGFGSGPKSRPSATSVPV